METTLVVAGIAFIGAAIAGGGLVAFQIEVPLIDSRPRQGLLAMFGAGLLVTGLVIGLRTEPVVTVANGDALAVTETTSTTASDEDPGTEPPADALSETTTYVWVEPDGWAEHASWVAPTSDARLQPILTAFNWWPAHPSVTAWFDDFSTLRSADDFEADRLSGVWGVGGSPGVETRIEDGSLRLDIPGGMNIAGAEGGADVWHSIALGEEFDVSVRFRVEDDFYSLDSGAVGLIVGSGEEVAQYHVAIWIIEGEYRSERLSGPDSGIQASTSTNDVSGGFRIVRSAVEE